MRDRIAADLALFGAAPASPGAPSLKETDPVNVALALNRPPPAPPPSRRPFAGRAALITGATAEPGLAVAAALAAAGADLALHGPAGTSLTAELRGQLAARPGMRVAFSAADLASPAEVEKLVVQAMRQLGRLDILIVNAAAGPEAAGPALRVALPAMRARGWGRIVVLAPRGLAAAHALVALTRGAALAGADRGATANLICLNDGQDTPAAAVGGLAALLCGEAAAMLTGAVLPIEGFARAS